MVGLATVGCRDAPTGPVVGLVAEEAYAALALGVTFPDPASWATGGELRGGGSPALDAWRRSWDLPAEEGRNAREALYASLAAEAAPFASAEVLTREVALLSEGVLRAEALDPAALPPHVAAGIEAARDHRATAGAARDAGDARGTLEAVIRGGDALREVGPEGVARALLIEVEGAFGRLPHDHSYSEQEMERLRRLVRGGRQALEEGDWVLTIRRAFYARALLQGNG